MQNEQITRRLFLKLAAGTTAAGLFGVFIENRLKKLRRPPLPSPPEADQPLTETAPAQLEASQVPPDPRLQRLKEKGLSEINPELFNYLRDHPNHLELAIQVLDERKKLGLKSIPREILEYKPTEAEQKWRQTDTNFTSELPPSLTELSRIVELFFETIYSREGFRTVKKVSPGGGTAFGIDAGQRSVIFPLFYDGNYLRALMVVVHEAGGHGIDPFFYDYYPPHMFFPLEVARWQMLSRSFSLEAEYFNLPEDSIHTKVTYELGKRAIKALVEKPETFSTLQGSEIIRQLIHITAVELQTGAKIIYTKRFAYKLGKKLLPSLRNGQEYFFQTEYESSLTDGLSEIYAEMIKWSLLPIEEMAAEGDRAVRTASLTQADETITAAVKSTIEVIRKSPVELGELRQRLRETLVKLRKDLSPPAANPQTIPAVASETVIDRTVATSPQEQQKIDLDTLITSLKQGQADSYTQLLSKVEPEITATAKKYFDLYQKIISLYPGAGEEHNNLEVGIEVFDPPHLNFWESEQITSIMKDSFFREMVALIYNGAGAKQFTDYMTKGIPVLENLLPRLQD